MTEQLLNSVNTGKHLIKQKAIDAGPANSVKNEAYQVLSRVFGGRLATLTLYQIYKSVCLMCINRASVALLEISYPWQNGCSTYVNI